MSIKKQSPSVFNDNKDNVDSLGAEWKNFVKECLMKTEIITKTVLEEQNENILKNNPNLVMNVRHAMVKNHDFATVIPPSKELIRSNKMKLLREERFKNLMQQKKERLIKHEIEKLKADLESYRSENAKQIEEITKEKIKHQIRLLKFSKKYSKSLKNSKLETESQNKAKDYNNFLKVKSVCEGSLNEPSSQPEEMAECFSEPMFHDRKGSMASFESDIKANKLECNDLSHREGKYLIMQKFFDKNYSNNELNGQNIYKNQLQVEDEYQTESPKKTTEKIEKLEEIPIVLHQNELSEMQLDTHKSPAKEEPHNESFRSEKEDEIKRKEEDLMREISKRLLKNAWITWKSFICARKKRRHEKKEFENKIEKFLKNLEEIKKGRNHFEIEKQNAEGSNTKLLENVNVCNAVKNKLEKKLMLICNKKQRKPESNKKEEELKALIEKVKDSQKDAYQHLIEIEKENGRGTERIKVMKSLLNVIDDSSAKEYPTPQFLLRMKKRTEERKSRWNEIQEKRKKLEEQKEQERKLKKEQELQAEEEEKKKKMEELRQKRIREKEKKERLLKEKEKRAMQMNAADRLYERTLLRRKFKQWSKRMAFRQLQDEKAEDFYHSKLLQCTLNKWKINVAESQKRKHNIADEFYKKNLRKFCFRIWIENCEERCKQLQVAVDWNELKVTEKFFKNWVDFALQENLRYIQLRELADLNYERKLKKKFLNYIKNYPEVKKREKEAEERKRFWRQKVLEIFPDYRPVEIFE